MRLRGRKWRKEIRSKGRKKEQKGAPEKDSFQWAVVREVTSGP
jgi:hypothetical protein